MTNRPIKLILLLTGIFIAGGVTGAFSMKRFGRDLIANHPMPDEWAPRHMRKLAERLELGTDQVEKIRPIVRRNMEEIGRVRNQTVEETRAIFERMQREVAVLLTPEQRVKFDEFNREMRERAKKEMPNKKETPNKNGRPREENNRKEGSRPSSPTEPGK